MKMLISSITNPNPNLLCLLFFFGGLPKATSGFITNLPSPTVIPESWKPLTVQLSRTTPATDTNARQIRGKPHDVFTTNTNIPSGSKTSLNSVSQQLLWVAGTMGGGALGTPLVTKATKTWYNTIPLPTYTPPNAIFGPVWSVLYASMGIASWRIRTIVSFKDSNLATSSVSVSPIQKYIMLLSFIHYALNIIWAPVFFGMKRLRLGHLLNIVIWLSLIPVIIGYGRIDLLSGALLLPYLLWLSFAIKLSSGICKLNPTTTGTRLFNNAKLESEIWSLRQEAAKKVDL